MRSARNLKWHNGLILAPPSDNQAQSLSIDAQCSVRFVAREGLQAIPSIGKHRRETCEAKGALPESAVVCSGFSDQVQIRSFLINYSGEYDMLLREIYLTGSNKSQFRQWTFRSAFDPSERDFWLPNLNMKRTLSPNALPASTKSKGLSDWKRKYITFVVLCKNSIFYQKICKYICSKGEWWSGEEGVWSSEIDCFWTRHLFVS